MSEVPVVKATPANSGSVELIAPSDLQEGYNLQVTLNGSNATVTVPLGGVKEGQSFTAVVQEPGGVVHNIPSGKWRDGLCDCCANGFCQAMCWLAFFDVGATCVAGQVMTRMSLNWFSGPGEPPSTSKTCMTVSGIAIGVYVVMAILQIIMDSISCWGIRVEYNDSGDEVWTCPDDSTFETSTAFHAVRITTSIVGALYGVYRLVIICQTRRAIRDKYNIPPGSCGGCEDCCCAWICPGLTVCQMARHTNDYKEYDVDCCSSDCCNKRGQKMIVPEIV